MRLHQLLGLAGIDTAKYKGHSTRAASTSLLAQSNSVKLSQIFRAAGWSNEQTFRRFYDLLQEQTFNLGSTIIDIDT